MFSMTKAMQEGKRKQESGRGSEKEANKPERRECEHTMHVAEHLKIVMFFAVPF